MKTAMLMWQAITPLHPGTGQDSASAIDLPVAREGGTRFPLLPASSIKGVLRDGLGLADGDDLSSDHGVKQARARFGFADRQKAHGKVQSGIGDLTFTDARLLALPVPSFSGTFALVTSPLVLARLDRDRQLLGFSAMTLPDHDSVDPPQATVDITTKLVHDRRVLLNDLDFVGASSASVSDLCRDLTRGKEEAAHLARRLCIVDDDVFAFLCETALEVTARVRLDPDRKTVVKGALWYEECLPAESLLTSFLISTSGDLSAIDGPPWYQMGGKSTVGRGLLQLTKIAEA